jgi:hypothetical protein
VAEGRVGDPELSRERLDRSSPGAFHLSPSTIELQRGKANISDRRFHGHLVDHPPTKDAPPRRCNTTIPILGRGY